MREIKFRARHKETGDWFYGSSQIIDLHPQPVEDNFLLPLSLFWLEVEKGILVKETTGEGTGLHDKNSKEIYEGDILRFDLSEMGYIELGFIEFIDSGFWMKSPNGQIHLPTQERREVIGNIHENPELLK